MKRVVIDYLERWKWPFIGGFVLHVILMTFAFEFEDRTMPLAIFAGSGFMLIFEFFRSGGSRTYLTLPMTSKDLGRAWRFVALEFPVVIFLVALFLAAIVAWFMGYTRMLNLERFIILALFQTLALGVLFFALTGLPQNAADQRTWQQNVQGGFFGLIWGFSIPACVFAAQAIPVRFADFDTWDWLIAICMAFLTVFSWFRAEILVLKRAQPINRMASSSDFAPSMRGGDRPARAAPIRGFGGIPFHCWHYARTTGLFGMLILFFNWFVFGVVLGQKGGKFDVSGDFTSTQVFFFTPIISMILALMAVVQLRMLRAMPISRAKLAALIIVWPMAFAVTYAIVAITIHSLWFSAPFSWDIFARSITGTAAMLLALPALLWFGFTLKGFLCVFALLPGVQILQVAFTDRQYPLFLPWWLPLILVPLSFYLTWRALESSRTWRAGALRFNAFRRA